MNNVPENKGKSGFYAFSLRYNTYLFLCRNRNISLSFRKQTTVKSNARVDCETTKWKLQHYKNTKVQEHFKTVKIRNRKQNIKESTQIQLLRICFSG